MKYYGTAQFSVLPEYDAGARGLYHFLAWGNHLDERWYRDMNQPDQIPNVAEYVNNHLDDVTQACDDTGCFWALQPVGILSQQRRAAP